jgi:diguanylate cyclase (GGDEF)-like protein
MNDIDREERFQSIFEVLATLKTTNQHQKVLHLMVDRVTRIFKCQTCAVIIIDPLTEYLHVENNCGLSLTFCKSYKAKLATGAIGRLLWTGKPILISDAEDEPQLASEVMLEYSFGSAVCTQISVNHRTLGYLHADSKERHAFSEHDLRLLQSFADIAGIALVKNQLYEENLRLEKIDRETGIEKYSTFLEALTAGMERAKDSNEEFSLLLLDVDNFKEIVHTYGYDASKQLLREIGSLVKLRLRPIDACGRYGFDEFIVLLANTHMDDAITHAKYLAQVIADTPFTQQKIGSGVSIGVSAYPVNGGTVQELLLTLKEALFEAQRAGRNTVYFYPTTKHVKGELVL